MVNGLLVAYFDMSYQSFQLGIEDQHASIRLKVLQITDSKDLPLEPLKTHVIIQNNLYSSKHSNYSMSFFSKHRPSWPMLSISQNFHLCVCVCVCLCACLFVHFLSYRLTVFLPPLPEVGCPIFLEIRNPWGKVMERSGLTFEHFSLKVV